MILTYRRAVKQDVRMLFDWRRDPETYRYFVMPHPVNWTEHQEWFRTIRRHGNEVLLWIVEENGWPCAMVRFDLLSDHAAEISITVAPEHRGRGIGTAALKLMTPAAMRTRRWKEVHAKVHRDNIASLKAFAAAGYAECKRDGEWVTLIAR